MKLEYGKVNRIKRKSRKVEIDINYGFFGHKFNIKMCKKLSSFNGNFLK